MGNNYHFFFVSLYFLPFFSPPPRHFPLWLVDFKEGWAQPLLKNVYERFTLFLREKKKKKKKKKYVAM